ncbi:MAG: hypothetical protein ACJAXT_001750 [Paracoccaceae bacterium]|jgi:hypothetical protein
MLGLCKYSIAYSVLRQSEQGRFRHIHPRVRHFTFPIRLELHSLERFNTSTDATAVHSAISTPRHSRTISDI